MPHMLVFNKNTQKHEFSDVIVLFEKLLIGGRRREAEDGGGHTDRMFCWVWTMLLIGANSNRPVQKKKVQHMVDLSGTLSSSTSTTPP